jgi:2-keto-3-deoxy-L-rhamnonate aldolase RhmA
VRPNSIRALLDAGGPTLGTHLFLTSPTVVEIVGHTQAFDYVEFLAEYAPYDLDALENFCRTAELHSLGTMIKVDWEGHRFISQRSVGAGFESVLFTDPRSADDVRDCIRGLRPDTPEGQGFFGVAPRRHALPLYGGTATYVQALNDVVIAVMVEKASAVAQLEEVLAVPGIDMIQWGPADYAMSLGRPGETGSKEVKDVEKRVIETCRSAGIRARAEINSAEDAKYYADLGIRDFCLGYDLFALYFTLKDGGERLRAILAEETDR